MSEIEMLRAANEAAVSQEQISRAEANRQRERADKAEQQLAKVNGWREGLRQRLRDRNDQLVVAQDLVFQYKQQLAQAQAQVAECKEFITVIRQQVLPGLDLPVKYTEWIHHALSTSCGRGMIHVAELDATIEFVREVHEWCVADNPCDVDADKAEEILTRLQTLRAKGTK